MGHSQQDPGFKNRQPWNGSRKLGAKRALKPQQVWAVHFWLKGEGRVRDRAMFDLAIDSKLRGCDLVKLQIGDLISSARRPCFGYGRLVFASLPGITLRIISC